MSSGGGVSEPNFSYEQLQAMEITPALKWAFDNLINAEISTNFEDDNLRITQSKLEDTGAEFNVFYDDIDLNVKLHPNFRTIGGQMLTDEKDVLPTPFQIVGLLFKGSISISVSGIDGHSVSEMRELDEAAGDNQGSLVVIRDDFALVNYVRTLSDTETDKMDADISAFEGDARYLDLLAADIRRHRATIDTHLQKLDQTEVLDAPSVEWLTRLLFEISEGTKPDES